MKKNLSLSIVILFLCVNFALAQDDLCIYCRNLKPNLNNTDKFEEAKKCKKHSKIEEGQKPVDISTLSKKVRVVTLTETCDKFKIEEGHWVTLFDEMKGFYLKDTDDFRGGGKFIENRLEKLIGVQADEDKCFVVYDIPKELLRKTNINDDNVLYPFTNNGFTCDWSFAGIGCRAGLSEFFANGTDKNQKPLAVYDFYTKTDSIYKCLNGDKQSDCSKEVK